MINFTNVSLKYDRKTTALQDISLNIEAGEFVFIVGPSGAGKSSIIKLLLRERKASSGIVSVNGANVGRLLQHQLPRYRKKLGVVFQDFRLIPHMTVYDNVAFSMRVTNEAPRAIKRRVPYILNLMRLEHLAKKYPHEISGGEQQRVALSRALVNDPPIIIADEPTGNIDPELSFEIVDLLHGINKCGTTIIMVTHEKDMVDYYGGRIIVIDGGQVADDKIVLPSNMQLDDEFIDSDEGGFNEIF